MPFERFEYTADEGCYTAFSDCHHDFKAKFNQNKEQVQDYLPSIANKDADHCVKSENQLFGRFLLKGLDENASAHDDDDESAEKKTGVNAILDPTKHNKFTAVPIDDLFKDEITDFYEIWSINGSEQDYLSDTTGQSYISKLLSNRGITGEVFFICDVGDPNIFLDLSRVKGEQVFYWLQNNQTLYDPATKIQWDTPAGIRYGFRKPDTNFRFCWEKFNSSCTIYDDWGTDAKHDITYDNKELMFYTNRRLYMSMLLKDKNGDVNDYKNHKAGLLITYPKSQNLFAYADGDIAEINSDGNPKGYNESAKTMKDKIQELASTLPNIAGVRTAGLITLQKVSFTNKSLSKRLGDGGQALSSLREGVKIQTFKDNVNGGFSPSNLEEKITGKANAFISFDRIAIAAAVMYHSPIVIQSIRGPLRDPVPDGSPPGTLGHLHNNKGVGFVIYIRKDLIDPIKTFNEVYDNGKIDAGFRNLKPTFDNIAGVKTKINTINERLDILYNQLNLLQMKPILDLVDSLKIAPTSFDAKKRKVYAEMDTRIQELLAFYKNYLNLFNLLGNINNIETNVSQIKTDLINEVNSNIIKLNVELTSNQITLLTMHSVDGVIDSDAGSKLITEQVLNSIKEKLDSLTKKDEKIAFVNKVLPSINVINSTIMNKSEFYEKQLKMLSNIESIIGNSSEGIVGIINLDSNPPLQGVDVSISEYADVNRVIDNLATFHETYEDIYKIRRDLVAYTRENILSSALCVNNTRSLDIDKPNYPYFVQIYEDAVIKPDESEQEKKNREARKKEEDDKFAVKMAERTKNIEDVAETHLKITSMISVIQSVNISVYSYRFLKFFVQQVDTLLKYFEENGTKWGKYILTRAKEVFDDNHFFDILVMPLPTIEDNASAALSDLPMPPQRYKEPELIQQPPTPGKYEAEEEELVKAAQVEQGRRKITSFATLRIDELIKFANHYGIDTNRLKKLDIIKKIKAVGKVALKEEAEKNLISIVSKDTIEDILVKIWNSPMEFNQTLEGGAGPYDESENKEIEEIALREQSLMYYEPKYKTYPIMETTDSFLSEKTIRGLLNKSIKSSTLYEKIYQFDIFLVSLIKLLIIIIENGVLFSEQVDRQVLTNIYRYLYNEELPDRKTSDIDKTQYFPICYDNYDEKLYSRNVFTLSGYPDINIVKMLYNYININDERLTPEYKELIYTIFPEDTEFENGKVKMPRTQSDNETQHIKFLLTIPHELKLFITKYIYNYDNLTKLKLFLHSVCQEDYKTLRILETLVLGTGTGSVSLKSGLTNRELEKKEGEQFNRIAMPVGFGGKHRTLKKRPRKTHKQRKTHYKKSHKKRSRRTRQKRYI
uniref:Uncharacterized protein n=1 Tax=viral metagenome TaxID=1070528 RepID=A0A6C0D283_9ZZZZ